jgi:hypothetical protein
VTRMAETLLRPKSGAGHFVNAYKAKSVELTGSEPVTPVRKSGQIAETRGNGSHSEAWVCQGVMTMESRTS